MFAYSLLPIDSIFAKTLNSLGLKFANIHENKVLANISELTVMLVLNDLFAEMFLMGTNDNIFYYDEDINKVFPLNNLS